jgi:hypothetical protein
VEQALAFFAAHLGVGIAEDESHRREKVALPGAIATDNDIGFRREWLDDGLLFVAAAMLAHVEPKDWPSVKHTS